MDYCEVPPVLPEVPELSDGELLPLLDPLLDPPLVPPVEPPPLLPVPPVELPLDFSLPEVPDVPEDPCLLERLW